MLTVRSVSKTDGGRHATHLGGPGGTRRGSGDGTRRTGGMRRTRPSRSHRRSPPSPAAPASPMSLSLLVFNVEYGGTKATDAVIADLKADVVGVLESYNRLPKIAAAAGYPYYDVGLQIMSKYPILEPSGADGLYSYIEVRPGRGGRDDQHPPRLRARRAEPSQPWGVGGRRGRDGEGGPALVDRDAAAVGHQPARQGLAGVPHRRPERALAPRLDGHDRVAAPWRRRRGLAGQRGLARAPGCTTPTARCTPTRSPIRATPGAVSRAARAARGASTSPTSADRSTS